MIGPMLASAVGAVARAGVAAGHGLRVATTTAATWARTAASAVAKGARAAGAGLHKGGAAALCWAKGVGSVLRGASKVAPPSLPKVPSLPSPDVPSSLAPVAARSPVAELTPAVKPKLESAGHWVKDTGERVLDAGEQAVKRARGSSSNQPRKRNVMNGPRLLDDFLYRTSLLTIVRGKCRYDRHESVRLVGGEWWGESSRGNECNLAPQDICPVCNGAGELPPSDAELAQYDGTGAPPKPKPCLPCGGTGYVPGPHWPYRFPEPPPLRVRT